MAETLGTNPQFVTTYVGEATVPMFAPVFLGNEAYKTKLFVRKEAKSANLKLRKVELEAAGLWKARNPKWAPDSVNNNVKINSERNLRIEAINVQKEFTFDELRDDWGIVNTQAALYNRTFNADDASTVWNTQREAMATDYSRLITAGNTTDGDPLDGLLTVLRADGDINLVTSPTEIEDKNDMYAALLEVFRLIPDVFFLRPELKARLKIVCSYHDFKFFETYQIDQPYKGIDTTQEGVMMFRGIPIVPLGNWANSAVYAAYSDESDPVSSALVLGVNLTDEFARIKMGFMPEPNDVMFIRADAGVGVGIQNPDYVWGYDFGL